MKKYLFGLLLVTLLFSYDAADARFSRRTSSYNRAKINSAISYLNSAKRANTRRDGLRYIRMAERQVERLQLRSPRDRNYMRSARDNMRRASRYSRRRPTTIMHINRAISDLRRIRGDGYVRDTRRPYRIKYTRLNDAKKYLDYASNARRSSTISRNLSIARSKLTYYRGRGGGHITAAIRYIDTSRRYLRSPATLNRSRHYARMARSRVNRGITFLKNRTR